MTNIFSYIIFLFLGYYNVITISLIRIKRIIIFNPLYSLSRCCHSLTDYIYFLRNVLMPLVWLKYFILFQYSYELVSMFLPKVNQERVITSSNPCAFFN